MTMPVRRLHPLSRGFTLTELAIVLGIIGLILGAIWTAAAKVYTNQKVAKATTELLAISQSIRNLYAGKTVMDGPSGNITPAMVNLGVFPADMIDSTGQPRSPWGTPVEIYGSWPDTAHFIIEFDGQDLGRTKILSQLCAPLLIENFNQTNQDTQYGVEYANGTWAAYNIANPTALFSNCTTASFDYSIH